MESNGIAYGDIIIFNFTLSIFNFVHKACAEQAAPAEQAQHPILGAEHWRRHQDQQFVQKGADLHRSRNCCHIGAEYDHRQRQGANTHDPHPADHFFVMFFSSHHQQQDAGNEEDQGCENKQDFAYTRYIFHGSQAYAQNI